MKQLLAISITALVFAFAAGAQAQETTTPPTITMTSPVAGVASLTDRITVTGDATDTNGTIKKVQYRIEGNRRWRNAILTNPESETTTYVFSFKNTKKGRARRVYVRAIDDEKNESDTIGRKIYRSRLNRAPVAAAATTPPTGDTGGLPGATSASVSSASQNISAVSEWAAQQNSRTASAWLASLQANERTAAVGDRR